MIFQPTFIYIKTCNHCGLKYLGKNTKKTKEDVYKYTGGVRINHLNYNRFKDI